MSWVIEPRDTLVLRDGRPMATGAVRAHTLPFPWPSSVVGLVRSHLGTRREEWSALRETVSLRGPWLVRVDDDGAPCERFFPAPRDALWFALEGTTSRQGRLRRRRLRPIALNAGEESNAGERLLVGLEPPEPAKPSVGPAFWNEASVMAWLTSPADEEVEVSAVGVSSFEREVRTHVALADARVAEDGMLFSTEHQRLARGPLRYGVGFDVDGADQLQPGPVVLGGEQRPCFLRRAHPARGALDCPTFPKDARRLRVVLATPAIFAEGAVPSEIRGARVVAAVVDRPEVISGWDYDAGRPKPTRRMAPAGSTYWVDIPDGVDASEWAKEVFMTTISTEPQDCRDGFGLALVGVA
jgi:CRISPR-associated protein Cmr3